MTGVCRSAALDSVVAPECPPGPASASSIAAAAAASAASAASAAVCGELGVGDELAVDHVGEPPLQAAPGLLGGLGLLGLLQVVVPAFAADPDLGDRGHVQDVVEPSVPCPREPVSDLLARGALS